MQSVLVPTGLTRAPRSSALLGAGSHDLSFLFKMVTKHLFQNIFQNFAQNQSQDGGLAVCRLHSLSFWGKTALPWLSLGCWFPSPSPQYFGDLCHFPLSPELVVIWGLLRGTCCSHNLPASLEYHLPVSFPVQRSFFSAEKIGTKQKLSRFYHCPIEPGSDALRPVFYEY